MKGTKALVFGLCIAEPLSFAGVSAGTIFVPDKYARMQWAVGNASPGKIGVMQMLRGKGDKRCRTNGF